jgi:hypothetical protein
MVVAGWAEFSSEQRAHGMEPQLLGEDGYLVVFAEQSQQNWQSEWLALVSLVVLSARFRHRGSEHSPDGEEELRARIAAVAQRVDELQRQRPGAG